LIDRLGERFSEAPAVVSEESSLSYRALAADSRRYSRWGLSQGLHRGDVVALLMANCPAYLAIWLGLSRLGVTVALLNTHLRGEQLAYAIDLVRPRQLICGASLLPSLESSPSARKGAFQCWTHGGSALLPQLDAAANSFSDDPLECSAFQGASLEDRALCIYTSGTTGLPKAANISHFRLMQWTHWFAGLLDTGPTDRLYDCLPMYHSIGGVVAPGAVLVAGGAVVLRERFSASTFWHDIVLERCTLFQYIGELCRYLLQAPADPSETQHRLRLCCGNGLRAEVWNPFQERFRIPHILEYYAATEGAFSLYNCEERVGSLGRIPSFLSHRIAVALLRLDPSTGAPLRDASGHCQRCAPYEAGEAVSRLRDGSGLQGGRFEGYADAQAATEHKLLHDVFCTGDCWYRSGDLMRQDAQGFFYFVDRLGDTFRWKGENVSTTEVADALAACRGVRNATAYGVPVAGTEGRACMAALSIDHDFDLQRFRCEIRERLPSYALPLFLRIVAELEQTDTFKLRKQRLLQEAFDPSATCDPLYFDDGVQQAYIALDAALHGRLQSGALRL
jgi:fatty-acyl-CoA synthase